MESNILRPKVSGNRSLPSRPNLPIHNNNNNNESIIDPSKLSMKERIQYYSKIGK